MFTIMLDAGHYAKYNRSPVLPDYWESDFTWKLCKYLKEELQKYDGVKVGTTRSDKNKDLEVYKRGLKAKGYNLFISLHSNATTKESVDYPVAYIHFGKQIEKFALSLAKKVAEIMGTKQDGQVQTRTYDNAGKTYDYYGVIRGAWAVGVQGIILEHSFHTNKRSTQWLLKDANVRKLAVAEAELIAKQYKLKKKTEDTTSNKTRYIIQAGAFEKKANADAYVKTLKSKGVDSFVTQSGKLYIVQTGAFSNKKNAEAYIKTLKAKGINAFIK